MSIFGFACCHRRQRLSENFDFIIVSDSDSEDSLHFPSTPLATPGLEPLACWKKYAENICRKCRTNYAGKNHKVARNRNLKTSPQPMLLLDTDPFRPSCMRHRHFLWLKLLWSFCPRPCVTGQRGFVALDILSQAIHYVSTLCELHSTVAAKQSRVSSMSGVSFLFA